MDRLDKLAARIEDSEDMIQYLLTRSSAPPIERVLGVENNTWENGNQIRWDPSTFKGSLWRHDDVHLLMKTNRSGLYRITFSSTLARLSENIATVPASQPAPLYIQPLVRRVNVNAPANCGFAAPPASSPNKVTSNCTNTVIKCAIDGTTVLWEAIFYGSCSFVVEVMKDEGIRIIGDSAVGNATKKAIPQLTLELLMAL